jgi:hypothetical protein
LLNRYGGLDRDRTGILGKTRAPDANAVNSKRQTFCNHLARVICQKCITIFAGFVYQLHGSSNGQAIGICDLETKLSGVALTYERKSKKQESEFEPKSQTHVDDANS